MARKVTYRFKPFDFFKKPEGQTQSEALAGVAALLKESILSDVGDAKSPIDGRKWQSLSKGYAKEKRGRGSKPTANLELTGRMLNAFKVKKDGNAILLSITGRQGDKADGHNNHSGSSDLPLRRFIPKSGEDDKGGAPFRAGIMAAINRLIKA